MEPNAGDIYGLQQQQRRMSKSNSRAHRMSVATGIRLIHSSEIRDICLFKIFQWKNSKNMLQFLDYENPSIIVRNFKFCPIFFFRGNDSTSKTYPCRGSPVSWHRILSFLFEKNWSFFWKILQKKKILFFENFTTTTRLLVSQGDGSEQISLPHGVVSQPQYQ